MPEWFYERGIGEARAALIEDGRIVEAMVEVDDDCVRVGTVADARLTAILIPRRRAVVVLANGTETLVEPLAPGWTEGATVRIEIVREAIPEPRRAKRAIARPATERDPAEGADLRARLIGAPVVEPSLHGRDLLEAAGWTEMLESAERGTIDFEGGTLHIEPTAAMTLIDVDGHLPVDALALAAASAAARAIRLLGIAGSIGIDFPSVEGRAPRAAVAAAFDAALPPPFERTALNGFGFMQIVRPRRRASLIEHICHDPVGHAARALLRRAERSGLTGAMCITAHPSVTALIADRADWLDRLGRTLGGAVALRPDPRLAISASHADRA